MILRACFVALFLILAIPSPQSVHAGPWLLYDDVPAESANKRFFATEGPKQRSTLVFRRVGQKGHEKIWEVPEWSPALFLTDDGDYLVVGYAGANLLEHHYKRDQVMVSFYRRGRLLNVVRLNQIMVDLKHLQVTDSGVAWGFFAGLIDHHRFAVDTVEHRRLIYDVTTGALVDVTTPSSTSLLEH